MYCKLHVLKMVYYTDITDKFHYTSVYILVELLLSGSDLVSHIEITREDAENRYVRFYFSALLFISLAYL